MKKSLKSLIASLATPAPAIQVGEDIEDETSAKIVESDEELQFTSGGRRKSDWDAGDDLRYKGKKISRKKMEDFETLAIPETGDLSGSDDDEISDVNENDGEISLQKGSVSCSELDEDSDEGSDDPEENELDEDDMGDGKLEDGEDSAQGSEEDDEEGSDAEDEENSFDDDDEANREEKGLGSDLQGFQTNVFTKTTDQSAELTKGRVVKRQLEDWDTFLQWRIQMQKLLQSVNQVPDWQNHSDFIQAGDKDFRESFIKAKASIKKLLVSFIEVREAVADSLKSSTNSKNGHEGDDVDDDEEITSSEENETLSAEEVSSDDEKITRKKFIKKPSRRRMNPSQTVEELDEIRRKGFAESRDLREGILQEWSEKTQLASRTSKAKTGFASFEQSALQQVNHILADKARLLKRTRLQRSNYAILGKRKAPKPEIISAVDEEICNPEIFDDDDFYQNLLREFIEKKVSVDGNSNLVGQQWLEMQNLRKKLKKPRLDRESKDRRIKYEVHPKMVSFMAPKHPPLDALSDEARNELFSCLFGKNFLDGKTE